MDGSPHWHESEFPTGGIVRELPLGSTSTHVCVLFVDRYLLAADPVTIKFLCRCTEDFANSGTDSKVWMREEMYVVIRIYSVSENPKPRIVSGVFIM